MSALIQQMHQQALTAQQSSYSPYSKHKVGAAVRFADGRVFSGCNVENASYGATLCAERTAVLKGISEQAPTEITHVVVISDEPNPWPPCGQCLQVLAEFCKPDTQVTAFGNQGQKMDFTFAQLFPQAFSKDFL